MTPFRRGGIAFLLTQLGTSVASAFATRVRDLGITPAEAGVLRILARQPGMSQRDLSNRLGTVQSRVVVLIDRLEEAELVTRTRSASDRRSYELALSESGTQLMRRLRAVAEAHEESVTAVLDAEERDTLAALLRKLAESAGLDPEVHPGYRAP